MWVPICTPTHPPTYLPTHPPTNHPTLGTYQVGSTELRRLAGPCTTTVRTPRLRLRFLLKGSSQSSSPSLLFPNTTFIFLPLSRSPTVSPLAVSKTHHSPTPKPATSHNFAAAAALTWVLLPSFPCCLPHCCCCIVSTLLPRCGYEVVWRVGRGSVGVLVVFGVRSGGGFGTMRIWGW